MDPGGFSPENYGTGDGVQEELLDFDRAMRDFQQMFPNICPAQIEYVLRKYDGDVSATINELLYDNGGGGGTPSSSLPGPPGPPEDVLTQLRRRRHQINEKLRENQQLLDRVTDVESARTYEDQQLALLLEHREVSTLISDQKLKQQAVPGRQLTRRQVKIPAKKSAGNSKNATSRAEKSKNTEKIESRRRSEEERVPDGPLIEVENSQKSTENFTSKIKETLRKASGSRISRLFSAP